MALIRDNEMNYHPPLVGMCFHDIYKCIMGYVVKTGMPRLMGDVKKKINII
jgi:hypothetical protein